MSEPIDLRRHPRLSPLIIRAEYRGREGSGEGYLLNLSEGGAFLATSTPFAIGGKIQLRIFLPWKIGDIRVDSRVVWRSDSIFDTERELPPGIGLEFLDISPKGREGLATYVRTFQSLADQIDEG